MKSYVLVFDIKGFFDESASLSGNGVCCQGVFAAEARKNPMPVHRTNRLMVYFCNKQSRGRTRPATCGLQAPRQHGAGSASQGTAPRLGCRGSVAVLVA